METLLARRIRLFVESGQVRPEVAAFVRAELEALAAEGCAVTEDSAGMLTSHLLMALTRLQDGEPVEEFRADDVAAAELADHPRAVRRARAVSIRAERALGAPLPESEINFLAMHFAVLRRDTP
ncbi:transcriptional antiterminator [Streptomyces griseoflavus]|uniref:PRD domain-containing protein n=1 Tax=Streptomyces rimosus TaxID=1927 RepID=UPI0004CBD935|nr:PRD domain-containing protein [Streptomyces rimosus]KOG66686.1 transcriptional antiterminator [Streptomyces griseoflavus]KWT63465.1 transcriptional antiterminator [Streptomyces albus subsp. albus]